MEAEFCRVCNIEHLDGDSTLHNSTQAHRFNFLLFQWNKCRKRLVKDRHGIAVKVELQRIEGYKYNFYDEPRKGKHCLKITPNDLSLHNGTIDFICTVKNNQKKKSIFLTFAKLLIPYRLYSLLDPGNILSQGGIPELLPGASYCMIVRYTTENITVGSYKIPIAFNLQTKETNKGDQVEAFTIARCINVLVNEETKIETITTKSPFTNNDWPPRCNILPTTQKTRYFDSYKIPPRYTKLLQYGLTEFNGMTPDDCVLLRKIRTQLEPGHVTVNNYKDYWHLSLWLEEMGLILMLKRYNMEDVTMKLTGDILELEVPGLAEKRPSLVTGDEVEIKIHETNTAYRGLIKSVNDKTIDIAFVSNELLDRIRLIPNLRLDVRFVLGRLPLERRHMGVEETVKNGSVLSLFPDYNLSKKSVRETRTIQEYFNELIVTNPEQKTAVLKILNGSSFDAPYIVFGPPGTGKTVTIVEAILQIKKLTNKKILVCAPANAACDMLTEKLMQNCTDKEMIRIISENVDNQNINQHVLSYTNYKGSFRKVTAEELLNYRIVIMTLLLVGRYNRKYHPDVVFIDEAAQASEPEVNCAIGMMKKGQQIILAGDPKQLGPSTASKVAEKFGLGKSLLERLMNLELYKTDNPNFITMLRHNFRSHSTILKIPNQLFYNDQLQAFSARSENDPLSKVYVFKHIPNLINMKKYKKKFAKYPGQAVEFCSVLSKERRQGRSPSYFNPIEMQMVLKYIQALQTLTFPSEDEEYKIVRSEQIGVIAPYIRQVYQIKDLLKRNNLEEVEVGTTETFQGREKRVIIISTVRANPDLLLEDKRYNLGFVKNDKRFNVGLTRAMSKLIVIGCAHVLGFDKKWLSYIELCEQLGGFCGTPYARRTPDVIEDIAQRMNNVKFLDSQHNH